MEKNPSIYRVCQSTSRPRLPSHDLLDIIDGPRHVCHGFRSILCDYHIILNPNSPKRLHQSSRMSERHRGQLHPQADERKRDPAMFYKMWVSQTRAQSHSGQETYHEGLKSALDQIFCLRRVVEGRVQEERIEVAPCRYSLLSHPDVTEADCDLGLIFMLRGL